MPRSTTRYYWVPVGITGGHWVLLVPLGTFGTTRYRWVSLGTTGRNLVLLGTTGYHWILVVQLGTSGYHWASLGTTGYDWIPQGTNGYHLVPLCTSGCHWKPFGTIKNPDAPLTSSFHPTSPPNLSIIILGYGFHNRSGLDNVPVLHCSTKHDDSP